MLTQPSFILFGIGTKATINKFKVQKWMYLKEHRLNKSNCMKVSVIQKLLFNIKACYNKGVKDVAALSETAYSFLNDNHSLEYLEFRDKYSLEEKSVADDDTVVFIVARVENVRLIDNVELC